MDNKEYKLSASLVCANMLHLGDEVRSLEKGGIDYLHFDVMDGHFVPRLGLHPEMLGAVTSMTNIPVDVHLMMDNPEGYLTSFAEAGADTITVHAESTPHLHRLVYQIKSLGMKAGVALNPATPLNVLDYVIEDIDLVLLMAINPGIVGHKLIPGMIDKIHQTKSKLAEHRNILIEVDGGVTPGSSLSMLNAGANMLVCGTGTIFRPKEATVDYKIKELRKFIATQQSEAAHA